MARTLIVKIGSSSLTNEVGVIDEGAIARLCDEVAGLRNEGHRVVLVSSGAVSAGVAALALARRPADTITLQALSALGQPRLMAVYDRALGTHGLVPAQVLLTPYDFLIRQQYLHARQTIQRLLDLGVIPIINENDAIADDEIRFSDNDRIAALVSHSLRADLLVLLTDIDGLYTADPRTDPTAELVSEVRADDPMLGVRAGTTGSNRGSGGMASKLTAARIASWSGVTAIIARSDRPNVLHDAVNGTAGVGTRFLPHDRHLPARKLWIAFAAGTGGRIMVDDGARNAVRDRGTSLLPAGITAVDGAFDEGATIDIVGGDGVTFARGMVTMSAEQIRASMGRRTVDLPPQVPHEAVHRDDLVVLD